MAMPAPCWASDIAIAFPMPRPPPVMSATRPSSDIEWSPSTSGSILRSSRSRASAELPANDGDVRRLLERGNPVERLPEVVASRVGAVAPQKRYPAFAERTGDLLHLSRPGLDDGHFAQVQFAFEVARYERIAFERKRDRVARMCVDDRLRFADCVDGRVKDGVARRRWPLMAAIGAHERDVALLQVPEHGVRA